MCVCLSLPLTILFVRKFPRTFRFSAGNNVQTVKLNGTQVLRSWNNERMMRWLARVDAADG